MGEGWDGGAANGNANANANGLAVQARSLEFGITNRPRQTSCPDARARSWSLAARVGPAKRRDGHARDAGEALMRAPSPSLMGEGWDGGAANANANGLARRAPLRNQGASNGGNARWGLSKRVDANSRARRVRSKGLAIHRTGQTPCLSCDLNGLCSRRARGWVMDVLLDAGSTATPSC